MNLLILVTQKWIDILKLEKVELRGHQIYDGSSRRTKILCEEGNIHD